MDEPGLEGCGYRRHVGMARGCKRHNDGLEDGNRQRSAPGPAVDITANVTGAPATVSRSESGALRPGQNDRGLLWCLCLASGSPLGGSLTIGS